jgi:hypothetical protein
MRSARRPTWVSPSAGGHSDMTWPEGVALELVLLGIGWIGFRFLTRNIRDFLDLRFEIRRHMQRFATVAPLRSDAPRMSVVETPPGADPSPIDEPSLEHGTAVFRQLGFRMLLFTQNARLAAWVVRMMGYDPVKAGDNLISLSHDTSREFRRKSIADALRFKDGAPDDDH